MANRSSSKQQQRFKKSCKIHYLVINKVIIRCNTKPADCHARNFVSFSTLTFTRATNKTHVLMKENWNINSIYLMYSVLASCLQLNHDDSASAAHAKEDDLNSRDTEVSILLSNMLHTSCIDGRFVGSGWMHRLMTSHIIWRSSFAKCFNSGSTKQHVTSGSSRNSFACRIDKLILFDVCVIKWSRYLFRLISSISANFWTLKNIP